MVYLLNEVPKHRLGDFKVGDDAVLHGADSDNVAGGSAEHALGLFSHSENIGCPGLNGHH